MDEDATLEHNPSTPGHLALLHFNVLIRKQPSVKLDLFPIHVTVIQMCIPRVPGKYSTWSGKQALVTDDDVTQYNGQAEVAGQNTPSCFL